MRLRALEGIDILDSCLHGQRVLRGRASAASILIIIGNTDISVGTILCRLPITTGVLHSRYQHGGGSQPPANLRSSEYTSASPSMQYSGDSSVKYRNESNKELRLRFEMSRPDGVQLSKRWLVGVPVELRMSVQLKRQAAGFESLMICYEARVSQRAVQSVDI